jgi:hypothetical protein
LLSTTTLVCRVSSEIPKRDDADPVRSLRRMVSVPETASSDTAMAVPPLVRIVTESISGVALLT